MVMNQFAKILKRVCIDKASGVETGFSSRLVENRERKGNTTEEQVLLHSSEDPTSNA